MSLAERVRNKLQTLPEGKFVSSKVLHDLSPNDQLVDKAVSRVYKTTGVKKLRNGLFFKPLQSKYFGERPPEEAELLSALKNQYSACVGPSGELAAYDLGFTTEMPETITYESDKRISPITIGNKTIHFRKVDSKKLASADFKLFSILKALEYLYKHDGLNAKQRRHAKRLLKNIPQARIRKALPAWPLWFQSEIKSLTAEAPVQYITGLSAFNIPWQGNQADWHQAGMLNNEKFQIAGVNYESAPDLDKEELFDCRDFLNKYKLNLSAHYCAKPLRAIKDILFVNIIQKERYPKFLQLEQFDLNITAHDILQLTKALTKNANKKQKKIMNDWLTENGIAANGLD